jgi:hypothetical protein
MFYFIFSFFHSVDYIHIYAVNIYVYIYICMYN